MSSAKSLVKVFEAQEDETGQQPSNIDVSQNSRKRPLSNGSRRGSNLLDVKDQHSSVENEKYSRAQESEVQTIASGEQEEVKDKRWRGSMTAEFKAFKNRGCWRAAKCEAYKIEVRLQTKEGLDRQCSEKKIKNCCARILSS